MNSKDFDRYRSETLWPGVAEHLDAVDRSGGSKDSDEQGIETVLDYLKEVVDEVPSEVVSWCESYSEARHIFTRYYPFSGQPVTLLLSNPRMDAGEILETSSSEEGFPTLEHRRYAATHPDDIKTLAHISAEHYNSYLYNQKGPECLLKRLGTVTDTLEISTVVDTLSEKDQWDGNRETDNSKIGSGDKRWMSYFYNPDETSEMDITEATQTYLPQPVDILTNTTGVTGKDRGLSAQAPDLNTGFYSDFYITNLYKLGSNSWDETPTSREEHVKMTIQEVRNAASKLVIAFGVPSQKVLIEMGEPVYEPNHGQYSDPATDTQNNYGVIWKLNSKQYGLAVPHPSRFNSELSQPFSGNSDEGWRLLSDALHYIESETSL